MDRLPSTEEMRETLDARDAKIRENWVRTMEARLVRQELQKCHKAEGVNHYQVCNGLATKYLALLEDAKIKGFRVIDAA